MPSYPFLSPQWIAAVGALRDEYADDTPAIATAISANVIVPDTPFDEARVEGHIDTTSGSLEIDEGLLESADLTIELPYELAYKLFVEREPQTAMQALFSGQIKITGDSSKLLQIAIPATPSEPNPLARELAHRIDELTNESFTP